MADQKRPRCSSCGAPIIWAKTALQKSMPINAKPDASGNIVLAEVETGLQAFVLSADALDALDESEPRYRSHFATCPSAARHRRARL